MTSITVTTSESEFQKIREDGNYYMDKSLLIKDILSNKLSGSYLFIRPRRFGKSMNLSMLDAFFNIKYKGNNWFDGLAIEQYPEYDDHKNAFPVIRMDMKDVRVGTWETFLKSFGSVVRSAFLSYRDLTDEDTPDYYVTFCQEILDRHSEEELLED